ncbi:hypothetical protein OFT50_12970 [Brachyspira hyodysenteriae]|nr:hypothetical protein [Brachyspira hyodysenteriae]MDA0072975.1 hypothetical protein [Brachyspira hyodysenteriae]
MDIIIYCPEAVQFLQFTGGLYSEEADYDEGNITSLVIKNGEDYSIWQFRRNANNPQVLNNNPPISGASITTVNGVDAYEGGSLNTDWDKLTEDYAVEATPNTVMGRDGEGASNVNMPSNIENTTVVNNQYLQQQLQEQLQAGLATKQDKLTAGTNITISEDNVISASGDLATRADLVTYDNSNTNLQYITGYDFPKFKIPLPDTLNLVLKDQANQYPATITKQTDGSYILNATLNNFNQFYTENAIGIILESIENETNTLILLSILNIFWTSSNDWIANNGDIQIEGISEPLQFAFNGTGIFISKTDLSNFEQKPYNITLTIKNRKFDSIDTYFLGTGGSSFFSNYLSYLNLQNNKGFVKLVGTINGTGTASSAATSSYSFLITLSNYFNLVSSGSYTNTTQITSSTGKAVKYYFMQNASYENAVDLVIAYQDGSTINTDDVFTFNLTPDKNSTVDPTYAAVTNVQELGEALTERLDKLDLIADGEEHPTGTYYYNADGVRKPIYYRVITDMWKKYQLSGSEDRHTWIFNNNNEWQIDFLVNDIFMATDSINIFIPIYNKCDYLNKFMHDIYIWFNRTTKKILFII